MLCQFTRNATEQTIDLIDGLFCSVSSVYVPTVVSKILEQITSQVVNHIIIQNIVYFLSRTIAREVNK